MPEDTFKPWFSVPLCPIWFLSPSGQNSNLYNYLIHITLQGNKRNEKAPRKHQRYIKPHIHQINTSNTWSDTQPHRIPALQTAQATKQSKTAEHKAKMCQSASLGGCACPGRGCFALVPLNSLTDLFLRCNSCPQVVPTRVNRVWHKARTLWCVASCTDKYLSIKSKCSFCSARSFSAARGKKKKATGKLLPITENLKKKKWVSLW